MSRWRYISDDGAGAAEGLATDEALLLHHGRDADGTHEATLRLYTYRSHCALVGRFQSLHDEVDLVAARRLGVEVARRPTGGGAIIMGAGQLGVAVATRAPTGMSPRELLARYAEGVSAGLARLGLSTSFAGKNDLQVGGRKVAGLGLYVDQTGALLFHASVLADLDIALMLRVLQIPGAKLSDKGIQRVGERVTTIARETGGPVPMDAVRSAIAAGIREALEVELEPGALSAAQRARRDDLVRERYAATEWTDQRSMLRDAHGTEVLKTPEGLVRVYVATHGATIKSATVAGDFNAVPAGITALEAALRWAPATREETLRVTLERVDPSDLGVPPQLVADAVWSATERALERASGGAHPLRPSGSCYFPEADADADAVRGQGDAGSAPVPAEGSAA